MNDDFKIKISLILQGTVQGTVQGTFFKTLIHKELYLRMICEKD